jgi:hypothetical protein
MTDKTFIKNLLSTFSTLMKGRGLALYSINIWVRRYSNNNNKKNGA